MDAALEEGLDVRDVPVVGFLVTAKPGWGKSQQLSFSKHCVICSRVNWRSSAALGCKTSSKYVAIMASMSSRLMSSSNSLQSRTRNSSFWKGGGVASSTASPEVGAWTSSSPGASSSTAFADPSHLRRCAFRSSASRRASAFFWSLKSRSACLARADAWAWASTAMRPYSVKSANCCRLSSWMRFDTL